MATTVAEPVFVDTNILIYAQQALAPFHATATQKLLDLASDRHALWIRRQVLREYLAAMSRPGALTKSVAIADLISDVQRFERQFQLAEDSSIVTRHLLDLLNSITCAGRQVHDANIVATMLAHEIRHLVTHNVADFTRFSGLITIIPLAP